MIRFLVISVACAALSACSMGQAMTSQYPAYQPRPGQGQYIRPEWLGAQPTPILPAIDACKSRMYAGLVGQHEGALFIAGLPGRKRVIKPAQLEAFDYSQTDFLYDAPPFVEVQEYISDQVLYAPAINTVTDRINLGPNDENRLTIELDAEGYVQQIDCR